jgi:hypothetical protein
MWTFLSAPAHCLRQYAAPAFHQRGFAHAGFANQDRVVLATTGENIHHLADFRVAAKHRVDATVTRFGGDIEVNLSRTRGAAPGLALLPFSFLAHSQHAG